MLMNSAWGKSTATRDRQIRRHFGHSWEYDIDIILYIYIHFFIFIYIYTCNINIILCLCNKYWLYFINVHHPFGCTSGPSLKPLPFITGRKRRDLCTIVARHAVRGPWWRDRYPPPYYCRCPAGSIGTCSQLHSASNFGRVIFGSELWSRAISSRAVFGAVCSSGACFIDGFILISSNS